MTHHMTTTGTRIAGGTAVVLAALLLSGCNGGDKSASPQHVSGTAAPATGNASKSASPDTSSEPSAPASSPDKSTQASSGSGDTKASSGGGAQEKSATTSRCHTGDLKATVGPNHPGAGQENYALVLTNTSGSTCTVYGYPGAAFVNSKGQNVSINPHREGGTKQKITLSPGESAWSALSYSNPQMTGVATVQPDAILITPPDEKQSLKVAWKGGKVTRSGAASVASVSPLRPGDGS
jgi:uncharacterized protein DUF4232